VEGVSRGRTDSGEPAAGPRSILQFYGPSGTSSGMVTGRRAAPVV